MRRVAEAGVFFTLGALSAAASYLAYISYLQRRI